MPELAWYWWVLIAVAVVLIGWLKLKVWGKMFGKKEEIIDE